jgi:predicted nucleic acid-binding protein
MKKKAITLELWQYVMDSSALINIQRNRSIKALEKRKGQILIPEQVAWEVAYDPRVHKNDPLKKFVLDNPDAVITFKGEEGQEYLRFASQLGIGPGEAAAMAVAFKRNIPLVIDEKETKARGKANNHGITTLSGREFLNGKSR